MGAVTAEAGPAWSDDRRTALADWLAGALDARTVAVGAPSLMSGGAIQENWRLDLTVDGGPHSGALPAVLRTDAASGVSVSHPRAQEYALLTAAFDAGVPVPEPLALDASGAVTGKPFYLMRRAPGTANPRTLARDPRLDPHRPALTEAMGRALARLHAVEPPRADLAFLPLDDVAPARRRIAGFVEQLDALPDAHPVLEWAVRWLDINAPAPDRIVLGHGDFRCGNLMVDLETGRLTAALDWEFAGWSDPLEDVGWLCARCWRFGADDREAGGIGQRADLYRGYAAEAGRPLDWSLVPYWEVLATCRWAVIALHQGQRHISGRQPSIELALTGRKAPEMEFDLLRQIRAIEEATP